MSTAFLFARGILPRGSHVHVQPLILVPRPNVRKAERGHREEERGVQ